MIINKPKGLFDILPYETEKSWQLSNRWQYVENIFRNTCHNYGFKEIRTPIFEKTELFFHMVGETSDIVTKELYTFCDKKGRSLSLRPEGTAPVVRSFLENNLQNWGVIEKLFYMGPMFRYERPQAGRYRQHHQFGAEAIGLSSFLQDAEIIDLLLEVYHRLGIKELTLQINSLGDIRVREKYKNELKKYLSYHISQLSKESKERLEKNPLRILDSKDPKDIEIIKDVPSILDFLDPSSKEDFSQLLSLLDSLEISYVVNDKLVRGLDYYSGTVFEITSGKLGAQNAIGGGGRYDNLFSSFGGPNLPGCGFGAGIERILQVMEEQNLFFPDFSHPFIYIIPLGEKEKNWSFLQTSILRHNKIATEIDLASSKIQKAIQKANKIHATFILVIGEEELSKKKFKLKNLEKRKEIEVSQENLLSTIQKLHKEETW